MLPFLARHSGLTRDALDLRMFNAWRQPTAASPGLLDTFVHDILHDPAARAEVLDRVINGWDSSGRGVRFAREGKFMGFLEPLT